MNRRSEWKHSARAAFCARDPVSGRAIAASDLLLLAPGFPRSVVLMGMNATRYTLVWGFYTNSSMLMHEGFEGAEGRKVAMARAVEIMGMRCTPYVGSPERKLPAVLEVYATAPDGKRTKARFMPQVAGSRFIRWTDALGQGWAVDACELGETIG